VFDGHGVFLEDQGVVAVPEQADHTGQGVVVEFVDVLLVRPDLAADVEQGEEDEAFVDFPIGLELKDVAVQGTFQETVVAPLHGPAEAHGLQPVGTVNHGVGLHFQPGMGLFILLLYQNSVGHGVCGQMAQIAVGKGFFGIVMGPFQKPHPGGPAVRALVLGQIALAQDHVRHQVSIQKVLTISAHQPKYGAGDDRGVGEKFVGHEDMGQRAPGPGRGRHDEQSDEDK